MQETGVASLMHASLCSRCRISLCVTAVCYICVLPLCRIFCVSFVCCLVPCFVVFVVRVIVFHVHVPCSVHCPVTFVGGALYNDPVTVCFVVGIVGSMRWDLVTPSVLVLYVFWCFSLVPMTL